MIGHPLAAAGALEAVATVKAITTGWLHPTINQFVRFCHPFPLEYLNHCFIYRATRFKASTGCIWSNFKIIGKTFP